MRTLRKIKIKWILVAVLVVLVAVPFTAHAQASTPGSEMSKVFTEVLQSFAQFLSILLKLLQRILWPIFLAIGGLLGNEILFGYGMEQRLLEVWVQIRNLVNIAFVVALLGVALFNVLAVKPDSEFALKTFLPKFAIALIAVNFSYVGMKIILDVSNVMTYAVFALPSSISEQVAKPDFMNCTKVGNEVKCTQKTGTDPAAISADATVNKICNAYYGDKAGYDRTLASIRDVKNNPTQAEMDAAETGLYCKHDGSKYVLSESGRKFFQQYNSKNVALLMAIQFMNVTRVDDVNSKFSNLEKKDNKGETTIDISGLAFQLLFAVVLYIVYGAAYLAIFVVLLTRIVALWLFIALSPLIVLKFVLPQGVIPESGGDIGDKFFKNAFAPVLMGVPLTIGYIILDAFKSAKYGSGSMVGIESAYKLVSVDNSAISDLQSMIIAFAAVAVVWVGVFAAAKGTFAEIATDMIKQQVKGLGTKAMQGLQMIPLIPAGQGGKGVSLYQAREIGNKPWNELMGKYGPGSLEKGKVTDHDIKTLSRNEGTTPEQMKQAIANANLESAPVQKAVHEALGYMKTKGTKQQQTFAGQVIGGLSAADYNALKEGRATTAEINRIRTNRFLKPENPTTPPPRTPAGTQPTGSTTTPPPPGAVNPDINAINEAAALGIGVGGLTEQRDKYEAAASLPEADKNAKRATITGELSKSSQLADVKKALKAKTQIEAVQRSGGNVDISKPEEVKALKKALDDADKALDKEGGIKDKDKRKEILGQVLQKATGGKTADLIGKDAEIGNFVKV